MWFASWFGKRQRSVLSSRSHVTYRLRLEALEDRWLPSQLGLTVTSLADSGPDTLRAAILTANAGSPSDKFTINFGATGTINLQNPLPDLNHSINLQGPGASSLTIEPAAGVSFATAIVTVDPGQTVTMSGLAVANGNAGGIYSEAATLTVANCAVVDNVHVAAFGGGIFNYNGTLTISNSIVSGNSAGWGGGILSNGALTLSASTISGNSSFLGGGIASMGSETIRDCTVSGNSTRAGGEGGGIYNDGSLIISNSTVSGNAAGYGGGIWNFNTPFDGPVTISGCTISSNVATYGGGIYSVHTPYNPGFVSLVTVRDCVFAANSASDGAAIYNNSAASSTLIVRGCTFSANTASDSGAGIYNIGPAVLQDCTLSGNTADSTGGGIFNDPSGTLVVKDSTVLDNSAAFGADIYNLGALTLDDSNVGVLGP
jgi:hypothetical protein